MGLSKNQGAWLISIIGIANTVARVVCGFISDLPSVDALLLNNLALVIAGVATFLCPLCYSFALLAVYAAVFGCGIGTSTSMLYEYGDIYLHEYCYIIVDGGRIPSPMYLVAVLHVAVDCINIRAKPIA